MKSSEDMIFIDLWRVPYNIPTSKVCNKAEAIFFFMLNVNIYPGIHLHNLKRGVLKTMPKKQQMQELKGGIIVRNIIFFNEV